MIRPILLWAVTGTGEQLGSLVQGGHEKGKIPGVPGAPATPLASGLVHDTQRGPVLGSVRSW